MKVYFHSSWSNETDIQFAENIAKQTPGNRNQWNSLEAVNDPQVADIHVSFNQSSDFLDPTKLILFCAEPPTNDLCSGWEDIDARIKFPVSESYKPQRWWISKSYDELKQMDPPSKEENLSWITSAKGRRMHPVISAIRRMGLAVGYRKFKKKERWPFTYGPNDGHILRMDFLEALTDYDSEILDLYGRGMFSGSYYYGEIEDKWDGLAEYRYSLTIENYKGPNYFSEKITDALLSWCMPIYWGCTNLNEFLPKDSFVEIDIEDPDAPARVKEIVESDLREENLEAISEARDLLLNEYQIWPTVEKCIDQL
jgi:hypothetical protein